MSSPEELEYQLARIADACRLNYRVELSAVADGMHMRLYRGGRMFSWVVLAEDDEPGGLVDRLIKRIEEGVRFLEDSEAQL